VKHSVIVGKDSSQEKYPRPGQFAGLLDLAGRRGPFVSRVELGAIYGDPEGF
jgi:hypothetical protein